MKRNGKEYPNESLIVTFRKEPSKEGLQALARLISKAYLRDQQYKNKDITQTDIEEESA